MKCISYIDIIKTFVTPIRYVREYSTHSLLDSASLKMASLTSFYVKTWILNHLMSKNTNPSHKLGTRILDSRLVFQTRDSYFRLATRISDVSLYFL